MTQATPGVDFAAALPTRDGELTVDGLSEVLTITRDAHGVAHVAAANEHDAWFGMGYASAQDRLWQMDFDRRRATGRWAEIAGPNARFAGRLSVATDILARRLRLADAARADYDAMSPGTRAIFDAYAAGVNAFLTSGQPLPVEYSLCGASPEPWEPWHSLAIFKVRHVAMGQWQLKLAWAELLARTGPEAFATLEAGAPPEGSLILPPGARSTQVFREANEEIEAAAEALGFLSEVEGGSNSWAVHGSRTTTGKPIVCNDSHRALDVPNAYWQVHVSCPAFNVSGATFAGFPAFPHFGFNGDVAWNITHTQADYQDLYIEHFSGEALHYETEEGPKPADHRTERIAVRGAEDVVIETWATRHGPIVHGDPRTGTAIALRYTATDQPVRAWEVLRPMLTATTVDELFDTQDGWVDPVNNLVAADTSGNIGYMVRGRLPIRSSRAGRRLPVPGWTGEHEWTGDVPFESLPRTVNPNEGFVATANQRVIDGDSPYISEFYAPPFRGDRLSMHFSGEHQLEPAAIAAIQADRVSNAALTFAGFLHRYGPFTGDAEHARAMLAAWDGDTLPDSSEALLYAYFRRRFARAVLAPILGDENVDWLFSEANPASGRVASHLLTNIIYRLGDGYSEQAPAGTAWQDILPGVLEGAWQDAIDTGGDDPSAWRWDTLHETRSRHPLSYAFPDLNGALDPPRIPLGGDVDTIQAAVYSWNERNDFAITSLSVYRQVVDFDSGEASFVVPTGVSGLPGTEHYADQSEHWRTHERIPMHRAPESVDAAARHSLTLRPA